MRLLATGFSKSLIIKEESVNPRVLVFVLVSRLFRGLLRDLPDLSEIAVFASKIKGLRDMQ
jgi:hypothetical protein